MNPWRQRKLVAATLAIGLAAGCVAQHVEVPGVRGRIVDGEGRPCDDLTLTILAVPNDGGRVWRGVATTDRGGFHFYEDGEWFVGIPGLMDVRRFTVYEVCVTDGRRSISIGRVCGFNRSLFDHRDRTVVFGTLVLVGPTDATRPSAPGASPVGVDTLSGHH